MRPLLMGMILPAIFFNSLDLFAAREKNFQFSIYGAGDLAGLNGYLQIPAGGKIGSTTPKRPYFDEINLKQTAFYKLGFNLDWHRVGIYGEYQEMHPMSEATLNDPLLTHAIFLRTGTKIKTQNNFDLYRLGMRYNIPIFDKLAVNPAIEFTAFDYSYRFAADKVQSTRSFNSATGRIGLGLNYQFTPNLTFQANLASSLPHTTNLQIKTANLGADYIFLKQSHVKMSVFGGLGYENIHFKDKQAMPNDILLKAPYAEVGLRLSF